MRTLATVISVIVAISALTVMAPGHAEEVQAVQLAQVSTGMVGTFKGQAQERFDTIVDAIVNPFIDIKLSSKDVECLAHNIYYEAGGEPEEGKVAVAMVTINRLRDGRFGKSICSVVDQKTVTERISEVTVTKMVRNFVGQEIPQTEIKMISQKVTVCQFSWKCTLAHIPNLKNQRWDESRAVAERILQGDYAEWQRKYGEALYFHAVYIQPRWGKPVVARIGGHIFFKDKEKAGRF